MLKIRITSPFRYQYFNGDDKLVKDHYLAAGDYYHLDITKDKNEIKYILSPNFTFKNYIHVDTESIPDSLANELNLETGMYAEEYQLPPEEEFIPTVIQNNKFVDPSQNYYQDDLENDPQPIAEPKENIFDQTTPSPVEEEVKEVEEETEQLGALNTPDLEPEKEVSDDIVEIETGDKEREGRKKELESLHYSKVKDIAELYNLEYTNKKEIVEQILNLEFSSEEDASRRLDPIK